MSTQLNILAAKSGIEVQYVHVDQKTVRSNEQMNRALDEVDLRLIAALRREPRRSMDRHVKREKARAEFEREQELKAAENPETENLPQ